MEQDNLEHQQQELPIQSEQEQDKQRQKELRKQQELLLDSDLLRLYPHSFLLESFTTDQAKELQDCLTNPLVKAYFRNLANRAIKDIIGLRYDRDSDRMNLCSVFNKLQGYLEVANRVVNERTWEE